MDLNVHHIKNVVIFSFLGTFSANESDLLREHFLDEVKSLKNIVFDLTELTYIDTTCIGEMIYCLKTAKEMEIKLNLVGIQNNVKIIFDAKRASKIFDVYASLDEALADF